MSVSGLALAPRSIPGLDITPAEGGYIVYQPELDRVHHLNYSARLILELCTGANSAAEIAAFLQDAYEMPHAPVAMVCEAIAKLSELRLIEVD